jgi:hypothetical protein
MCKGVFGNSMDVSLCGQLASGQISSKEYKILEGVVCLGYVAMKIPPLAMVCFLLVGLLT